jgi:hypothetical protein
MFNGVQEQPGANSSRRAAANFRTFREPLAPGYLEIVNLTASKRLMRDYAPFHPLVVRHRASALASRLSSR